MFFDIYLYRFKKKKNSTLRPVTNLGLLVKAQANSGFDVLSPSPRFNFSQDDDNQRPASYNYMYIPSLNRYYWIRSWSFFNGMWTAQTEVDVLASWRDEIGEQTEYVVRSAAEFDGDMIDSLYPAKSVAKFTTNSAASPWWTDGSGFYVLGVIGGDGLTQYIALSPKGFTAFVDYVFSDPFFNLVNQGVPKASQIAKAQFNPMQYLSSVKWFPFNVEGAGATRQIHLGWWEIPQAAKIAAPYTVIQKTLSVSKHPQSESRGGYLNVEPYSSYTLDIRPWGRMTLDSAALRFSPHITLNVKVDSVSGVGILEVLDAAGNRIALSTAQVGIPIQVSQVVADYIGGVASIAGGFSTAIAGNFIGSISGIVNGAAALTMPRVSTNGSNGGRSNLDGTWDLIGRHLIVSDEDNEHRGRPLCQKRKLSTLPGYQMIADSDVNIRATTQELDDINHRLEDGYYFE